MQRRIRLFVATLAVALSTPAIADFRADYRLLKGSEPAPLQRIELSGTHLRMDTAGTIALLDAGSGKSIILLPAQHIYLEPDVLQGMMQPMRQMQATMARAQLAQMDDSNRTAADFGNKLSPLSVAMGLMQAYQSQLRVKREQAMRPALETMAHGGPHMYQQVRTQKQAQADRVDGIGCEVYRQSTNGQPSIDLCFAKTTALGLGPADAAALSKALALQAHNAMGLGATFIDRESLGDRLPSGELLIKYTHYDSNGSPIMIDALDRMASGALAASDFAVPTGYTDLGATLRQQMQLMQSRGMNGVSPH